MFVPCCACGRLRRIKDESRTSISEARARRCVDCGNAAGTATFVARQAEVDEMAVERLLAGNPPGFTTRAERAAAVLYLTDRGASAAAIADRLGITTRSVQRVRSAARRLELEPVAELMAA